MTIILHELALRGDARPSPFCWHARFSLAHKNLPYTAVPTGFTGIPGIAGGGHKTVPVMEHAGKTIGDSWAIAEFLEATYPDRPSLFGGAAGKAYAVFMRSWGLTALRLPMLKVILMDIYNTVPAEEQTYFRTSREQRFGAKLEEFVANRDESAAAVRANLEPLRATLAEQPYLSGETALYPDYVVAGYLLWWRAVSPRRLLESDDPVTAWFQRVMALYPRIAADSTRAWDGP
jgi:glutathione S-transferase